MQDNISFYVAAPNTKPFGDHFKSNAKGFFELPHRKFSILTFIKLLIFIKENEIHIIHSHGKGAGIYSRLASFFGLKVFHTSHGIHKPKNITDSLKLKVERLFSKTTDLMIFVSNSERDLAIHLGILQNTKSKVIFNGIEVSGDSKERSGDIRKVCILSRFDPHKNVSKSIELFANLHKIEPEMTLTIAGDGEEKANLTRLVKKLNLQKSVSFVGFIEDPHNFLRNYDLYLSSSQGEGLPYTVLEAINEGVIPLVSKVAGHKDILTDNYLFSLSSNDEFINKFSKLQKQHANQLRSILEKDFNVKKQIKKVVSTYNEN